MSVEERLTDDEIATLKQLAQEEQKEGVNRRELMQAAGLTGLGALLGGGSTAALVGQAKADASTSDADGNVGLPSDRVDVFADGIDSNSVNTNSYALRRDGYRIEPVSEYATGGTGKYVTADDHFTGGALASALSDAETIGREPKGVLLDGSVRESPVVIDRGNQWIGSPWGSWHQIAAEGTGHCLDVQNPDVFLERIICTSAPGEDLGDGNAMLNHSQDEQAELFVRDFEAGSGTAGYGIKLENGREYFLSDLQLEGDRANEQIYLNGISELVGTNWRVRDENLSIEDCEDVSISNVFIKDGSLVSNPSPSAKSKHISVDGLVVTGSGRGIFANDDLIRSTINLTAYDNADAGLNTQSNDCVFTGTVTNNGGDGVLLGGNRTMFVGISSLNSGDDIKMASGATECIAQGWFGSATNNGSRCIINGVSPNSGDPSSTGDWNGNASKAAKLGVVVEDTSNNNLYRGLSKGSWSQIG